MKKLEGRREREMEKREGCWDSFGFTRREVQRHGFKDRSKETEIEVYHLKPQW